LTQRALAARTGIPQETIARIEAGRSDPRVETLDRLLEATGMGLEVMPRLGIGIDRTQFQPFLDMTPGERIAKGIEASRHFLQVQPRLRRTGE
jgi:transcriptional regulator with XRE-family HTH domain